MKKLAPPPIMPTRTFVTDKQIAEILGINRRTVLRWVRGGILPKPVKIEGVRFTRWKKEDIEKFISSLNGD